VQRKLEFLEADIAILNLLLISSVRQT